MLNKDIEFNLWDKYNKEMYSWEYIAIEKDQVFLTDGSVYLSHDACILLQYTGIVDKNKQKLYNGDIVQCGDDLIVSITWSNGGFQLKTNENQGNMPAVQERLNRFVKIGNIYENPELLKTTT